MEILLAYIGVAIMTAGAFVASSIGVTITGNAVVGAMKKNPDAFGSYLILSALPASQGLYGLVGFFMLQGLLVEGISQLAAYAILCLGIMMAVSCLYSSIRQAQVCANGITATGAGHNVSTATLVMAVFPELYSILALLVVILTSFTL
jgi:V/A-type H+-transporting ATPase subunit K